MANKIELRRIAFVIMAWAALCSPASAAPPTVTAKTAAVNAGNTTLNASSQSFTAGNIILAMGVNRGANATDTLAVNGTVSGAFTLYECNASANNATQTANKSYIAYKYATGGSEVVSVTATGGTPVSLFIHVLEISGAKPSSAEDAARRACNGGTVTTSPSVVAGSGAETDELLVSVYGRALNQSGFTYSEDTGNGWTQIGAVGGNTNLTYAAGYATPAGAGSLSRSPTTTSSSYSMAVMGFKSPSGTAPPAPSCRRGSLMLLGVGC